MLNEKIPIRIIDADKQIETIKEWKIPKQEVKFVIKFTEDARLGKITGNQICDNTLLDYITKLKVGLEFLNKISTSLTQKDTEKLSEALLKDKVVWIFKKKDADGKTIKHKKPYSERGKIKIKNYLVNYLNWRLGSKANKITDILKVKPKLKEATIDYLKEGEIEKLYKACKSAEERFLIAVLFDSGARAEEFHNIRKEDIELPKGDGFVKLTLKEEYSKTKGRTISLYWKNSFEAVHDYVKERISEGVNSTDPIFNKNYKSSRKFLERLGKKVLSRSIHYHLFRHSSATYYANKMNRQQLCIRYGWRFRSPMPDRYIARIGVQDKELDEKFTGGEIKTLKESLEKEKQLREMDKQFIQEKINILMENDEKSKKIISKMQMLIEMYDQKKP